MTYTVKELNEWYENLEGSYGPEDKLPRDNKTPFGEIVWEDQERDYSDYNYYIQIGDRYFKFTGFYDSWNGVDWAENYGGWVEVEKATRTETYWKDKK